ncbi:putative membrane-anchored protein [Medicago truncatula]|uniref:Membrane-anchored ubiquitin-fold protein n=1 Tax=Medicago truncatula TaxID=3880 RepID=G7KQZ4_MEDTR|nr:membrane-anchored ubiquitin-fold protein 3 [Medicago truncatula]XP_024626084.1 membrane-anchored ubiquitin-fold protein 3 [Medicago truncatula]AES82086.2 membrane-anchored ubiquitin-fold protein 4 precursor [Medicago truncatula]AFK43958.1 unknown [Medicago truncatula]RHN48899.1 putative membrane-anchored protein [Medicago truncatula]
MAEGEERIELKFRIYDGTDIAHDTYPASTTTVGALKQKLITEWPQGKTVTPKSVNDIKLIHAGKVLGNSETLAESRITIGDIPGAITMHVVVQPPVAKKKTEKKENRQKTNSCACSCTIL